MIRNNKYQRQKLRAISDNLLSAGLNMFCFKTKKAAFNSGFIVSAGGLEPPTLCLKGRCSTPELRAQKIKSHKYIDFTFLFQMESIII